MSGIQIRRYDHPVTILRNVADQIGGKVPTTDAEQAEARAFHVAASTLDAYERQHRIVFEALDKDALAAVREEYERLVALNASSDLSRLVADLLGLED